MLVQPTRLKAGSSDTTVSLSADVKFDERTRKSLSEQPLPTGGALKALREAAEMSGLDAVPELYNEALKLANDGHLGEARERVQVLLGLNAADGEARLLLAKLQVAGHKWTEALTTLDLAQKHGAQVPVALRRAVEDHLRAEQAAEQEREAAIQAREQGEVKALRTEARRLRSENAQLLGRSHDLERETRKWAWTTASISAIGILIVGLNFVISGSTTAEAGVVAAVAAPEGGDETVAAVVAEDAPVAEGAAEAPPTTGAIADRAREALATADGLDDTELKVVVRGTQATVTGTVLDARQKTRARAVLAEVEGVSSVDVAKVNVLARTKGTEHVVGKGDTLSKIAVIYYGDSALAGRIQKANAGQLKNGTGLSIGQKLKIPAVD